MKIRLVSKRNHLDRVLEAATVPAFLIRFRDIVSPKADTRPNAPLRCDNAVDENEMQDDRHASRLAAGDGLKMIVAGQRRLHGK